MKELSAEDMRPQLHFTARRGWINDPNGCVFAHGEWHLFYQHNPHGNEWGNMTWGHAVSKNLIDWEELELALLPDHIGTIYSGSAFVDWKNCAGFQSGSVPPLVAAFTYAGEFGQPPCPYTQALAFSNDRGRTWTKYEGNPVLPNISGKGDRDPKIFWHEASRRWIMVLYLDSDLREFAILNSANLKDWVAIQKFAGFYECPEFFPLSVEGEGATVLWVLQEASSEYVVGRFDGRKFEPMQDKKRLDLGPNYYAAQNFNDVPAAEPRCLQIAWMRGGEYPGASFNQQMSFPCELTLRKNADGYVVRRSFARELRSLPGERLAWESISSEEINRAVCAKAFKACRFQARLESGMNGLQLQVHGVPVSLDFREAKISCSKQSASLPTGQSFRNLEILVDTTSVEILLNDGEIGASFCFVPQADTWGLHFPADQNKFSGVELVIFDVPVNATVGA